MDYLGFFPIVLCCFTEEVGKSLTGAFKGVGDLFGGFTVEIAGNDVQGLDTDKLGGVIVEFRV